MIISTSLIRRRDDISLEAFQRHWLAPHGPLTAALPGTIRYHQNHVKPDGAGTNATARKLRIDGFPTLAFTDVDSRRKAHTSPQMAACNEDSRQFIGAVSRVISDDHGKSGPSPELPYVKQIFLLPRPGRPVDLATLIDQLEGVAELIIHSILEQGGAPNSMVPFIGTDVAALAEVWTRDLDAVCRNAVTLEASAPALATFEVRVHRFI